MTLSDSRTDRRSCRQRWRRDLHRFWVSPNYARSPFLHAVLTTPADRNRCASVASLSARAFPVSQAGRHPQLHFRGLLKLHSRYGLQDCSPTIRGLYREASARPVIRPGRSQATGSYRQLPGWVLPSLVFCAVGAHWDMRA